jgi:radical SAM superfamily enzyme YgiQ (UPF0313 family)
LSEKQLHPLRPTTKLVVELRAGGVQLSNRAAAPPVPLTFPDLQIISELQARGIMDEKEAADRVAGIAGVAPESVLKFIKGMITRGRARRRKMPIPVTEVLESPLVAGDDATWRDSDALALKLPLPLRQFQDKFQLIDHDGLLLVALSPAELIAVSQFTRPLSFAKGLEGQRKVLSDNAVAESRLCEILSVLESSKLLSRIVHVTENKAIKPEKLSRTQANKIQFARQNVEQDEKEALRQQETGVSRPKVIPVWFDEGIPAALGLVFAYAKAYEDGKLDDFYDFRLNWVWDDDLLESFTARPAIYLCSNYLWSHEKSIAVSKTVKRLSPGSITIHGGPDTPKYEEDAKAYLAEHPHVDIIVRGEGEASAADVLDKLRDVIGQENPDLSVLADVQGITYRHGDEIIRNPDRPRILDLDTIPSPYITGLFDAFKGVPRLHATLETNRGCPYGCTFCDWGSATTSKIRKFDLDRVFGELKWCSDAKVQSVSQADANFGVFERDVSIAEWVGELKKTTGYPETFGGSYAKNSTKYLQKIIKVMAEAGILAQGVLSLQTMDENTLSVIKRSNIKVEKYDALANEMRNSNLQLSVELMMGLPGATLESFIEDLQQCIDRDIPARINHTTMLVNSPMNNPDYRNEHQIETSTALGPGKMPVLVSTKTYTRDDLELMLDIRQVYILLDNFGVLRLCSRFVRQQTGMTEMAFYCKLHEGMSRPAKQVQWPLLSTLVNWGQHLMAPVYSWALVIDELRRFLIEECGIADDSSLDAILKAQHALMPAHGRVFPFSVELSHDVVEWHAQMVAAKAAGHWRDWQLVVPPLSEFGAGRLDVNDKEGCVADMLGCDIELSSAGVNWDMDSSIGRARVDQNFNPAWEAEEVVQVG